MDICNKVCELSDKNPGLLGFMFKDDFETEYDDSETVKKVREDKI